MDERYQVVERIAAGGMGTLWRARHLELDVDVALKIISEAAHTPGSLRRFKREAQAAARLRSPNIVQVLDYGEFDGKPYLAMELLRGEDLATRLERTGKMSEKDCLRILESTAKAVAVAHDAGIVHRDLKPANIFLERLGDDEIVKILDFGVAKDLTEMSEPTSTTAVGVVGSPAYMSPEQVWGQPVSRHADLWAMAVVAFEILTGENPFLTDTLARTFDRVVRDPLPKLRNFEPALPVELEVFFERALAREPERRFGSAKELVEALRTAIEGHAQPLESRVGAGGSKRLRWPIAGGTVLAFAAGIAIVTWLYERSLPSEPREERARPAAKVGKLAPKPELAAMLPSPSARATVALALTLPPVSSSAESQRSTTPEPSRARQSRPPLTTVPEPRLDPRFGIPVEP